VIPIIWETLVFKFLYSRNLVLNFIYLSVTLIWISQVGTVLFILKITWQCFEVWMLRPHLSWFWKVCLGTHLNLNGCMYSYRNDKSRSSLQKIPNVPFPIVVAGGERSWTCEGTGVVQGSHKLVCHRKRKLIWREEKKLRKGWSGCCLGRRNGRERLLWPIASWEQCWCRPTSNFMSICKDWRLFTKWYYQYQSCLSETPIQNNGSFFACFLGKSASGRLQV